MTYRQSTEWLFNQFPSYQIIGKVAYNPDITNTINLCNVLKIKYENIPFVHVAGTNGKGSTTQHIASISIEKGLKTGVFTSPHLVDFRERISVNSTLISEEYVIQFCEKIKIAKLNFSPSFFEITFAMALAYFQFTECELCIIETGIGGRLDATNIITPILSIITNIGFDHTDLLGDTITKIAKEKAGIIKKNIPVVIGEYHPESMPVFIEKAKTQNAAIHFAFHKEYDYKYYHEGYKSINETTIRTAIELLKDRFKFTDEHIENGIKNLSKNTGFRARMQTIQTHPLVIIDVAHNLDGIHQVLKEISKKTKGKLHIIYGASADKDIESIISIFPAQSSIYFCEFSSERTTKLAKFKEISTKINQSCSFFKSIKEAYPITKNTANQDDTILIMGSFFLISDFFINFNV